MKQKSKIFRLFIPITRVDEVEKIVEGYAFVNAVIPGEKGGVNLKRSAMEAATPDYIQWGAVREMHQASAAGTANNGTDEVGVEWDDQGAYIRCKISDDVAWQKVLDKVYKGFSVGVRATVMRGKDIEACVWVETSLVDRPMDPDALITSIRVERVEDDPDNEIDVDEDRGLDSKDVPARENLEGKTKKSKKAKKPEDDEIDDEDDDDDERVARITAHVTAAIERGAFADIAKRGEKSKLRYAALDWLSSVLVWGDMPAGVDATEYTRTCIAEFQAYWLSRQLHVFEEGEWRGAAVDLARAYLSETDVDQATLDRIEAEKTELLKRAEKAEGDLTIEREKASSLQVRVTELESMPKRVRPMKYGGKAIERTFGSAGPSAETEIARLQTEMRETTDRGAKSTDQTEKANCIKRVGEIRRELAEFGVTA